MYFETVDGSMGERNERTEKCVRPGPPFSAYTLHPVLSVGFGGWCCLSEGRVSANHRGM